MSLEQIDTIIHNFILFPSEPNAVNVIRLIRSSNLFHLSVIISEYFISMFPGSTDIKDECAISSYYISNHEKAYDIHEDCLSMKGLSQDRAWRILFNQHFSINEVADRYIFYNKDKINEILNRKQRDFPLVTLTITTCKRFDLFEKTMNSIINCVDIDQIDFWFCVDDNSSSEDRQKMKDLYPFFEFYFKDIKEKGHPQSMNIIRNYVKTPYLFHLEDDWKFFVKRNYIKDSIDIIESNKLIGQCLFNKNYAEIESDIDIKGGIYHTTNSGLRYFIHEYCKTEEDAINWKNKYGNCKSSFYWPHWSLRPSVSRTYIFKDIGEFNEQISHFEMDYAHKYANKGYISAFFEGIYCLHTGRLTSEREDETKLNAYKLNNEMQFYGKENAIKEEIKEEPQPEPTQEPGNLVSELKFKTYVVNLDRRSDRWDSFKKNAANVIDFMNYERFSAIDGKIIKNTSQLQQIFESNDYYMRRGMVGCLLSHVKISTELINSDYDYFVVLEDDVEFTPDFKNKFDRIMSQVNNKNWDLIFLGHHVRDVNRQKDELVKDKIPVLTKRDAYWSFLNSLGGTGGYIISKFGAIKLLDFIDKNGGSSNGIDTLIQKSANDLDVYYPTPHLIFTDCYRGDNNIDTDIQYDHSNDLVLSLEQRIEMELAFYENKIKLIEDNEEMKDLVSKTETEFYFYYKDSEDKISEIINICVHSYYLIEKTVIFVIPNSENIRRYYHRFKIDGKYDISDVFA
jgi:GR25 family glycosyltransferase involved in LPS biosynthesis